MTEELDAIMFDAGGVLWDLSPSHGELFSGVLEGQGVTVGRERLDAAMRKAERLTDDEFAKLGGGDETAFWKAYDAIVLEELGAPVDLDRFSEDLGREFRDVVTRVESWVPYPDAVPALEAARRREFKLGLISNATELARRVLRNLDMERFFDLVVISEEVGVRKPDPRIFRAALDMAGTRPGRTLFIGDRPATDAMGAANAGMRAVLVDRRNVFPDSRFIRMRSLDGVTRWL